MRRLQPIGAPLSLALRRLRRRPLQGALLVLALAGAGAIIEASSVTGALAQEESVRLRLGERSPGERALSVRYRLEAGERKADLLSAVRRAFSGFEDVTTGAHEVEIWDPIAPPDQRGIRLVAAGESARDVSVTAGRLPGSCERLVCEALALTGSFRLGERVELGRQGGEPVIAEIVGQGSLAPGALPRADVLQGRALLVPTATAVPLGPLERESSRTVLVTAPLIPEEVHAWDLAPLAERLREATVRLARADPSVRTEAPVELLRELDRSGRVARDRLLLVAGQGAALVLAFAAFVAAARREDVRLVGEQLETVGASRGQLALVRAAEVTLPALLGVIIALAALRGAVAVLGSRRDFPSAFVGAALPLGTIAAVLALGAVGAAILFSSAGPRRRPRFGVGPLEVAAVTALGLIVWQTTSTSALDPEQIASGRSGSPILLLTPALAVFAAGVLLLRLLPASFRIAERLTRRAPFGVRLGLLSAARNPAQAAAATTFLAVALGSALFSLNYRASLQHQASDAARFAVGASWRVQEKGVQGTADVSPLTRFARIARGEPVPGLRLTGYVEEAAQTASGGSVEVVALPSERLVDVLGWRTEFSSLTREQIAKRLRPQPLDLRGAKVGEDASAIRLWARARSDVPRRALLHFLLPGQRFERLELGRVARDWKLLTAALPRSFAGAELVGIEFPSLSTAASSSYVTPSGFLGNATEDKSFVELGGIAAKRPDGWSPLPSLDDWAAAETSAFEGFVVGQDFEGAPVAGGLHFDLLGTPVPLIRPPLEVPQVDVQGNPGPYVLPALVSAPLADAAVDRSLTLEVLSQEIRLKVVARSQLFPTVTRDPEAFVVLDYDRLFATLNLDRPGAAPPTEAWFFESQPPLFASALARPPFRADEVLGVESLRTRLLEDPLAAGTTRLLTWSALAAAVLGLFGLVLATRSALASERQLLAEYEALGVPPATLARSVQVRLIALAVFGLAGALVGAALAVRLVSALVAVTGTAGRPLPPIEPVIAWQLGAALLAAVAVLALVAAFILATRVLRETAARRLRAQ